MFKDRCLCHFILFCIKVLLRDGGWSLKIWSHSDALFVYYQHQLWLLLPHFPVRAPLLSLASLFPLFDILWLAFTAPRKTNSATSILLVIFSFIVRWRIVIEGQTVAILCGLDLERKGFPWLTCLCDVPHRWKCPTPTLVAVKPCSSDRLITVSGWKNKK